MILSDPIRNLLERVFDSMKSKTRVNLNEVSN